jgi:hypothetical protein
VATLSKKKRGMWQHLNSKKQQEQIDWRRAKVLELMSKGETNQSEMAKTLQVDRSVISKDVATLRERSRENLQKHIQDKLPEEYQRCLTEMNQVLKLSWDIATKSKSNNNDDNCQTTTMTDDKTRIQALALANDCYKYIMELTTNGVVITDAIKFVQTNKEKLVSKEEENGKESKELVHDEDKDQLEEKQEEETGEKELTTNQVF